MRPRSWSRLLLILSALLLFVLFGSPPAFPDDCLVGTSAIAVDFESITVSTTAIGFTGSKITPTPAGSNNAVMAVCTLESNPIRYRDDGTDPTSTVGHLVNTGEGQIRVCSRTLVTGIRFIRSGASDGTLQCTYYRGQ